MTDAIAVLLEVQDKDVRLANLQRQVDSVPEEKRRIEAELAGDEEALEAAKQRTFQIESRIKTLEMDIGKIKEHKVKLQQRTTAKIKNDEYRLILHEIAECDTRIRKLEDQELDLWEQLEEARETRAAADKILKQARARIEAAREDLDVRAHNCQGQIEKVQAERDRIAEQVPADILRVYEQLVRRRAPDGSLLKGVVPVVNDCCGFCFLNQPPDVVRRTKGGEKVTCGQCGRLLYYDP